MNVILKVLITWGHLCLWKGREGSGAGFRGRVAEPSSTLASANPIARQPFTAMLNWGQKAGSFHPVLITGCALFWKGTYKTW